MLRCEHKRSTSQSLLRHRPDHDQPPHPPGFNIVCISPRLSYGPFKLFSPRKGIYTTFNLKASLKGLYGGLSGTDCFLPATSTPAIAPARNQPFAVQKALPGRKPSEVGLMPLAHLQVGPGTPLEVRPASGTSSSRETVAGWTLNRRAAAVLSPSETIFRISDCCCGESLGRRPPTRPC